MKFKVGDRIVPINTEDFGDHLSGSGGLIVKVIEENVCPVNGVIEDGYVVYWKDQKNQEQSMEFIEKEFKRCPQQLRDEKLKDILS